MKEWRSAFYAAGVSTDSPLGFTYDDATDTTIVGFRDLPVALRGEVGTSGVMIGYGPDGGMVSVTFPGTPEQALHLMKTALDSLP